MHKTFRYPKLFETPKGCFTNFVGIVRQQISDGNSWWSILPLSPLPLPSRSHRHFGYPKVSGTHKNSTTNIFGPVRQHSRRKIVIPSVLSPTFLVTLVLLEHRKVPYGVSWSCKTKKNILTGSREICLLSVTILATRIFLKHRKILLRSSSVHWDKYLLTEIYDKPLSCIKLFDTRNFLKHRRVALLILLVLWDNKFLTGTRDGPSFPLSPLPLPSRSHRHFGYPKVSGTHKNSATNIFGPVRQHSRRKIVIPSVLSPTFLVTLVLLEHRKVPYGVFWSCRTKKFDGKSLNMSLIFNISRHQIFTEKRKSSTTTFFGILSQKTFDRKLR